MLTPPDMQYYHLQGDFSALTPETRMAFRHILTDAKARVGFDTAGERLLVQYFASRDGGCEIFVTKMAGEVGQELTQGERRLLSQLSHDQPNQLILTQDTPPWVVVILEELSSVLALCRRLVGLDYLGDSWVYALPSGVGEAYGVGLRLCEAELGERYAFLYEYGDVERNEAMMWYIAEHGREICAESGVERLGVL